LLQALLFSTCLAQSPATEADEAYERALEARNRGDLDEALSFLRTAHQRDPRTIFAYNIAVLIETQGQLDRAYEAYKLVTTLPLGDEETMALAATKAARLEPLLSRGVLHCIDWPDQSVVQLDDRVLSADERVLELPVEPGAHQLHIYTGDGRRADIWRVTLRRATVTGCPFGDVGQTRGALSWPGLTLERLAIDDYALLTDPTALDTVGITAGPHRVSFGVDGHAGQQQIEVIAGATTELALPSTDPPDSAPTRQRPVAAMALTAGGTVLAGVGGALLTSAHSAAKGVRNAAENGGVVEEITEHDAFDTTGTAIRRSRTGVALLSSGAGIAAIGVVAWAW